MKIKLAKLKINRQQSESLPLFYNFILHNELIPNDPYHNVRYSQRLASLMYFYPPDKPISKIIDPTKKP